MAVAVDPNMNAVYIQAACIWQDQKFKKYINKYAPELFAAFMDFMHIGDYDSLMELNEAIWLACTSYEGQIKPEKMRMLTVTIEDMDRQRVVNNMRCS